MRRRILARQGIFISPSLSPLKLARWKKRSRSRYGNNDAAKPAAVGTVLSKKDFTIELKECDGISKATVEMDSQSDSDDDSMFALEAGGATGVALKIEDDKGTQQVPKGSSGTPIEWAIDGETTSLHYRASYVVVNTQATGGTANALVNFSITYE